MRFLIRNVQKITAFDPEKTIKYTRFTCHAGKNDGFYIVKGSFSDGGGFEGLASFPCRSSAFPNPGRMHDFAFLLSEIRIKTVIILYIGAGS